MKRITILATFLLFSQLAANAQDFRTGIGIRGGLFSGLSIKHFVSQANALEGVVATHHRGLVLAGMYQMHANAFDAPGLNWYYGGGAHLGFYNYRSTPWFSSSENNGNFSTLGLIGVVGLEYKIDEIPITIGVDVTPAFNLIGHTGFWINTGLTLRYVLN
jgi:hypothetical protein